MFSKHVRRLLVLGVVLGSLVTAAGASAATVTVSPGGRVTGTTGAVQFTFNTARRTLVCSQFGFTATLFSNSGSAFPINISTDLIFFCRGARGLGGLNLTVVCGPANLNVTGPTSGGITPISITGINCTVSANATCSVRITGSVRGTFNNTGSILTISNAGQSLVATGSTCSILPNDPSVSLTDTSGGSIPFTVTPTTTINAV